MRFKGYDWTELLAVWNEDSQSKRWPKDTKKDPFRAEEAQAKWIKQKLDELGTACTIPGAGGKVRLTKEEKVQLKCCRQYLRKISKFKYSCDGEVWAAIANIEDNGTFTQWLSHNLICAWT